MWRQPFDYKPKARKMTFQTRMSMLASWRGTLLYLDTLEGLNPSLTLLTLQQSCTSSGSTSQLKDQWFLQCNMLASGNKITYT